MKLSIIKAVGPKKRIPVDLVPPMFYNGIYASDEVFNTERHKGLARTGTHVLQRHRESATQPEQPDMFSFSFNGGGFDSEGVEIEEAIREGRPAPEPSAGTSARTQGEGFL